MAVDPHPSAEETRPASPAPEARRRAPSAPYIVLVGLDLSEPGGRAWRFAFELADMRGEESEVHAVVVGARGMAPDVRDVRTRVSSHRTDSAAGASDSPPPLKVLEHRSPGRNARLMAMHYRTGRPDRAILQLAVDLHADVIVVATQPTSRLKRLLGGSVADRIARRASCPVVVVRPKADAEDPGLAEYTPQKRR